MQTNASGTTCKVTLRPNLQPKQMAKFGTNQSGATFFEKHNPDRTAAKKAQHYGFLVASKGPVCHVTLIWSSSWSCYPNGWSYDHLFTTIGCRLVTRWVQPSLQLENRSPSCNIINIIITIFINHHHNHHHHHNTHPWESKSTILTACLIRWHN